MEVKALMLLDCSPQVWCSLQTPGSGFLLTQTPEDSSDGSSYCTPDTHVEDVGRIPFSKLWSCGQGSGG